MRRYRTLSLQDVCIYKRICHILHGAAKFFAIHFVNIVSYVEAKFQTRLRIFNRMMCLKRDYMLRLRFTSVLYVLSMCSVNDYNVLHNITEKSSTFFLLSCKIKKVKYTCHVYFILCFFLLLFLIFFIFLVFIFF